MTPEMLRQEIEKLVNTYSDLTTTFDKEKIRTSHINAKFSVDAKQLQHTLKLYKKYKSFFAEPAVINIKNISPKLINVNEGSDWEALFRITRGTWSMPLNKGYGRRLRYVVFDEHHEGVIGIIGFQSPPADLSCRDELFDYPENQKLDLVNQTMDIYSLGAIPPYSGLLGGKLVAGLAGSKKVISDYAKKYSGKETVIEQKVLDKSLVALTTTSAFGRSSIYNRLKFKGRFIAESIGYTKGYGNLHLEPVYPYLVQLLKENGLYHAGGYVGGPKQRWQNITRALKLLNLPGRYARHGVFREVFLYRLRDGLETGMSGGKFGKIIAHTEKEFSDYWLQRWAIPRANSNDNWKAISTETYILEALDNELTHFDKQGATSEG